MRGMKALDQVSQGSLIRCLHRAPWDKQFKGLAVIAHVSGNRDFTLISRYAILCQSRIRGLVQFSDDGAHLWQASGFSARQPCAR